MNKYRLIKKGRNKDRNISKVIGIAGTAMGCGSTYISLMVANALKKIGSRKVAYIDMCGKDSCSAMVDERCKRGDTVCVYKGVTYYTRGDAESILDAFNGEYDHIIIDFGNGGIKYMKEFMRCDVKIVVGLATPWKLLCFENYLINNEEVMSKGKWRFVFNLATEHETKKLRGRYRIKAVNIEYEECFYVVNENNMRKIIALLEG